jgi:hypothetical protein
MTAWILVFAHRYFALTDAEGRYRIDDVPAGTYTVVAWNDGQPRETRSARVPEGGTAELEFVVDSLGPASLHSRIFVATALMPSFPRRRRCGAACS